MQSAETGSLDALAVHSHPMNDLKVETLFFEPPSRQQRRAMSRNRMNMAITSATQRGGARRKTRRLIARKSRQRNRR